MYFHSDARRSSPLSVREPQTTRPAAGIARRQLIPSGFSSPFSASVRGTLSSGTPIRVASKPAGAFHTPRCVSVRAKIPATAPQGTNSSIWLSRNGLGCLSRGKKRAAFLLFVPMLPTPLFALSLLLHPFGGSTRSIARRSSQYFAAYPTRLESMLSSDLYGGMHRRLKISAFCRAYSPSFPDSFPVPVKSFSSSSVPSDALSLSSTPVEALSSAHISLPAAGSPCAVGTMAGMVSTLMSCDSFVRTRSTLRGLSFIVTFRNCSILPVLVSHTVRLKRSSTSIA